MRDPYFPIGLDAAAAELHFHTIDNTPLRIGDASVRWKKMRHPGESVSYRVEERGKKAIFSTDTELSEADFQKTDANRAYFEKADLVIMDSQYTLGEAIENTIGDTPLIALPSTSLRPGRSDIWCYFITNLNMTTESSMLCSSRRIGIAPI